MFSSMISTLLVLGFFVKYAIPPIRATKKKKPNMTPTMIPVVFPESSSPPPPLLPDVDVDESPMLDEVAELVLPVPELVVSLLLEPVSIMIVPLVVSVEGIFDTFIGLV